MTATPVVILLAAGRAQRFGGKVKALLELPVPGGVETILARHHRLWTQGGAEHVIVVTSRANEALVRQQALQGLTVLVADGRDEEAGSAVSLSTTLRALQQLTYEQRGVVVLDADTVYDSALVRTVLSRTKSTLYVSAASTGDDEEVRVYGDASGEPVLLGKALPDAVTGGLQLLGESLGVIAVSERDLPRVSALLQWMVGEPPGWAAHTSARHAAEHEDVWQLMFALRALGVHRMPAELIFSECDTQADYEHILTTLLPALHALESNQSGALQTRGLQRPDPSGADGEDRPEADLLGDRSRVDLLHVDAPPPAG